MAERADACPCDEVECVEACAATFTATMSSCAEAVADRCPEAIDDSWVVCKAACQDGAGECGESSGAHSCAFGAMLCESECGYCIVQGDLAHDYEGSCELELPGSLPASHSPEAFVARRVVRCALDLRPVSMIASGGTRGSAWACNRHADRGARRELVGHT